MNYIMVHNCKHVNVDVSITFPPPLILTTVTSEPQNRELSSIAYKCPTCPMGPHEYLHVYYRPIVP